MRFIKKLVAILFVGLIVAAPIAVWRNHYAIADWYALRDYAPPAKVVALANDTAMSDHGRKLFYVNSPDIDDKTAFNQDCTIPEATIVLGCFSVERGIFVLQVDDPRLAGVEQVTAAHEMLHAAYERLNSKEKAQVDGWLEAAFTQLNNTRINKTIDGYRSRDPEVVNNELHSILGTESRDVGPELEAYYKRYFDDRSKVVGYSEQYEQVFEDIKAKVDTYDAQLKELKQEIDAQQASLDIEYKRIGETKATMEAYLEADNISAYNARVPGYNSSVRAYNAALSVLQAKIEQYNNIVKERNSLALEQRELVQAIDSKAIPQAP